MIVQYHILVCEREGEWGSVCGCGRKGEREGGMFHIFLIPLPGEVFFRDRGDNKPSIRSIFDGFFIFEKTRVPFFSLSSFFSRSLGPSRSSPCLGRWPKEIFLSSRGVLLLGLRVSNRITISSNDGLLAGSPDQHSRTSAASSGASFCTRSGNSGRMPFTTKSSNWDMKRNSPK